MAAISGKNTQPEILVRRILHGMGYRYRLHTKNLPGQPDIVFTHRRKIIEVRGCFWHRHPGCQFTTFPKTREAFWTSKFEATLVRDARNLTAMEEMGWGVLIVWECEIKDPSLRKRLRAFLGRPRM